jgi:hypothetical protein
MKSVQEQKLRIDTKRQRGVVALVGVFLLIFLGIGVIGFVSWTLSHKPQPVLQYTPPKVTADDPLSAGKSTKEIFQDVKILDASVKRGDDLKAATEKVLADTPISSDVDPTTNNVGQDRLSELQTKFIDECNRRIASLTGAQPLLKKLTAGQRPGVEQLLNKAITDLNSMRARVVKSTDTDAFASDQQVLNQEYNSYLLVLAQANLLAWADDQSATTDKFNIVGGKFQERSDAASNDGKSVATAQTQLNSYQANKVTAKPLTANVIKIVPTIRPGEHNSNRSVLKTYYDQLSTAHNELTKANASAKLLALEVQKFDK